MFSLIPLPAEFLSLLAGIPKELHESASAFSDEKAYRIISINPQKTWDSIMLTLGLLGLFFLVFLCTRRRDDKRLVMWILLCSGAAQAMYGSMMVITGLEYGFFTEKTAYRGYATGTFVNRNHMAGYMEMTLSAGIGLLLSYRNVVPADSANQKINLVISWFLSAKFALRVMLALMVVALVLTRSRMGNTAFFFALGIVGLLYVFYVDRKYLWRAIFIFVSILVIDLWILGSWFGLDQLVERLEKTDIATSSRQLVFHDLIEIIHQNFWVGVGLGNFSDIYSQYRSDGMLLAFYEAHNDYAQFWIETGLIGCLILSAVCLWTLVHAFLVIKRRNDYLATGTAFAFIMAFISLAIHSVADFNLQIPANAATLMVLMALVWTTSSQKRKRAISDTIV